MINRLFYRQKTLRTKMAITCAEITACKNTNNKEADTWN
jgi:hypothetical protein